MTILLIGFVKFETKQDQFCVQFILASETARALFLSHFLKKETAFS